MIAGSRRWDGSTMDLAPRLRVISRTGVGYDTVDVVAATARGVAVCFAPDAPTVSTAEHTVALLLAVTKDIGGWANRSSARAGCGARDRARRSDARSVRLRSHRPSCRRGRPGARHGHDRPRPIRRRRATPDVTLVEADELWRRSDVVTLHAPATPSTRHVVDADHARGDAAGLVPRQLRPRQPGRSRRPAGRPRPRSPRRRRARRHRARAAARRPPAAPSPEGRHHPAHRIAHRRRTSAALHPRHRQRPGRARRRARVASCPSSARPARSTS